MNTQHKQYDRDFRVRAVRRVVESGLDLHQVASDLGIIPRQLSTWLRRHAVVSEAEGGAWRLKTSVEIVQELRKDIVQLKQELERVKQVTSVSRFLLS